MGGGLSLYLKGIINFLPWYKFMFIIESFSESLNVLTAMSHGVTLQLHLTGSL